MDRREFIKKSGMAAVGSILLATPFASILAKAHLDFSVTGF